MDSKERMMLALNKETPDRLPVTIHQWQPYHLRTQMGGMDDIDAFREVGLDASITYYEIDEVESPNWRISLISQNKGSDYTIYNYEVNTPSGNLFYSHGQNEMTSWVIEPLIKKPEDIYILKKHRPIPSFNKKGIEEKANKLKGDGIVRTFLWGYQGGCWQDACELMGLENLIYAAIDDNDWVHEFLNILLEQKLAYIDKNLKNLPIDLIETGGGAASNTVISPSFHEEFCLPYDYKLHSELQKLGYPVVYHTCGGMKYLLEIIPRNGADVSETLSPTAMGGDLEPDDYQKVKESLGSKVALIGGIDQFNVLPAADATILSDVKNKFEVLGKNGGYIMSACDHFFELAPDRLKVFAQSAKICTY